MHPAPTTTFYISQQVLTRPSCGGFRWHFEDLKRVANAERGLQGHCLPGIAVAPSVRLVARFGCLRPLVTLVVTP